MSDQPTVTSSGRIELAEKPSRRKSPEEFLESFDLSTVPPAPGCYIMYDEKGRPIYVGKANNLRARVRTYITERDSRYSVKFLMRRVAHIEFLVTTNEKEALLLENSLIKQYKPRYNVRLKDDKTYVSLRLDVQNEFPRLTVVRRYKKDGARYFGPYSSAQAVRETLRQIHRIFPLRRCSDNVLRNRTRPCLYCQMGQCMGPCDNQADREAYLEMVEQVILVLEGRSGDVEKRLMSQIQQYAGRLEFEKAAQARDRLAALKKTIERQRTVAVPGEEDRDVFGYYGHGRFTELQVLFFRGGKLLGGRSWTFHEREMPLDELVASFILQYYSQPAAIPAEVLVPLEIESADTLAEILAEERAARVSVHWPQRGEKRALVDLAMRNAESSFKEKQLAEAANRDLLEQVRQTLHLPKTPNRIECYDISTLQGERPVGSMVTFEGGEPAKNRYRHYAIRSVEGQDDYAMLREVLLRRFKRAVEEHDLPDLVLMDGGKGQLNVATTVLKDLGLEDVPAASIAKSHPEGGEASPERFFIAGRMNPIIPPQHGPVVRLLARIRDEAHRFAITYHRKKRSKATLRTALTDIPGVGPRRARLLLNKFGSVARIREATAEQIAGVPGFSKMLAETILAKLKENEKT
ncbi:MAG TPA: excinuclease ABC subunit UvrC [Candidatus Bathyarchaeia archaeon]|nr:excinuclease ABC subunit UvrC [Candidatus Bathyarchaeia archaeon]